MGEIESYPLFDLPSGPRIGSVFSGTGALDLGVRAALGGSTAWFSDISPTSRAVLAHRFPDVPNLGDISAVNWATVEPVDVLIGGFPCTDVSAAGRRAGLIRHGQGKTRSGLWVHMAKAIENLHPELVVIENVKGLLHAPTDFDPAVLACPSCVDHTGSPSLGLRAHGAVLGDLADLGYDAAWRVVAAGPKPGSVVPHVGCCHRRERVFIIAWPADTAGQGLESWVQPGQSQVAQPGPGAQRPDPGSDVALLPTPAAANPNEGESFETWEARRLATKERVGNGNGFGMPLSIAVQLLPTPDAKISASGPDYARMGRPRSGGHDLVTALAIQHPTDAPPVDWGKYTPAIRMWEAMTRPAPAPTAPGPRGAYRLSPRFVEWMMGFPSGWVTDVPLDPAGGPERRQRLRALGDAVVPQQVTLAVAGLLGDVVGALGHRPTGVPPTSHRSVYEEGHPHG